MAQKPFMLGLKAITTDIGDVNLVHLLVLSRECKNISLYSPHIINVFPQSLLTSGYSLLRPVFFNNSLGLYYGDNSSRIADED